MARVKFTSRDQYCYNAFAALGCDNSERITIPSFSGTRTADGGDWAMPMPKSALTDLVSTPAPPKAIATATPRPTPTTRPTSTPRPTPTPWPTATPKPAGTPTPVFAEIYSVPAERVATVKNIADGADFWKDKEPFVLMGCHADVSTDTGGSAFSNLGGFGRSHYLVLVSGWWGRAGKPPIGKSCYDLYVSYQKTEEMCFQVVRGPAPPVFSERDCSGWTQRVPQFRLPNSEGVARKVFRSEIRRRE